MKIFLIFLLAMTFQLQAKSCKDLGRELCGSKVTMDCLSKNFDKVPANCLKDISEQVAQSHPCFKQMNSGQKLSKKCSNYFAQQEARSEDMMKNCKPLNDCQVIYQKISDKEKADKEYQSCIESQSKKMDSSCSKVFQ